MTHDIGQMTGHGTHAPITVDTMEITLQVIGTIGLILFPVYKELTMTEDKHSKDQSKHPEDGQADRLNWLCFSVI